MGKIFKDGDGVTHASWSNDGHLCWHFDVRPEDIPAFIAWLTEGPPNPKWRITKTFDEKPKEIHVYVDGTSIICLTDADVERVL